MSTAFGIILLVVGLMAAYGIIAALITWFLSEVLYEDDGDALMVGVFWIILVPVAVPFALVYRGLKFIQEGHEMRKREQEREREKNERDSNRGR